MLGKFWLYRRLRASLAHTDYYCLQLAAGVVYARPRSVSVFGVVVDLPNGSVLALPWASISDFSTGPAVKEVFDAIAMQIAHARANQRGGRSGGRENGLVLAQMDPAGSA